MFSCSLFITFRRLELNSGAALCNHSAVRLSGQLDQAATWLLENAENMAGHPRARTDSGSGSHSAPLSGVEVKAESVCICFIDDCLDCDIPLAELTFSSKTHEMQPQLRGYGHVSVSCSVVIKST